MLRDFWQEIVDTVYDAVNSVLFTQEEIDDIVSTQMGVFAGYTDDPLDIPGNFDRRKKTFDDPVSLIRWIARSGIPPQCVFVRRYFISEGEAQYVTYISQDS